ncbi:DNA-binding GntR family transcriptional regulator [Vreelandella songnenensis]|uniref:DNA-binding GntR family transcriptional regulator n=1 Tax=Vreelandella songnenensis TaxID=1176243 RepID=A0A2T0V2U2_9GAMM|nr:GntR family transcriptional regulator [Halomonas songnenensis]PRY64471.1 DNA-binding GntR family transcriptional regulator [Halomonas songnenensis]
MNATIQKRTLLASRAEIAYNTIEEMIVTLELAPGESLTEQALCARLEMGRTPVREALLRLKHDYLLTVLPRQGILIRPIDTTTALEALDVRHHLEGLLIERAARLASESQRAEFVHMARQAEQSLETRDNRLFSRIDKRFNERVCEAANHVVAARAVMPLHAVSRRIGFFLAQVAHHEPAATVQPHIEIMQSIAANDGKRALDALAKLHHLTRQQTLAIERDGLLHL